MTGDMTLWHLITGTCLCLSNAVSNGRIGQGCLSLASIYCVGHGGGPGYDVHNDSCKDRSFYIEIHRDQKYETVFISSKLLVQ